MMYVCAYLPWRESYFSHKTFVLSILFSGDPGNINESSSAHRIPSKQILICYQSDDKSCFLKCDQLIIHFSWLGSRWIFVCRRMWPREDTLCLRVCLQDSQLQLGIAHVTIDGGEFLKRWAWRGGWVVGGKSGSRIASQYVQVCVRTCVYLYLCDHIYVSACVSMTVLMCVC